MASGQLGQVWRRLRGLVGTPAAEPPADAHLLERFVAGRDMAAFEALAQRYGPLVLGVCRRVLGNTHDAEDAFQATFLIFARRAASIQSQGAVGSWLCGTAYRVSLKAKAGIARRRAQERNAGTTMVTPNKENEAASTKSSIACRRSIASRWCSATWKARPTRPPPASSAGRRAPCRTAWPRPANGSANVWCAAASP
jgi:hypothetical protein